MLRFRAVPTNDDFTSGSMSSLFLSLKKTAKRLARGDYNLQDDLVSVAWTRILQYKNKSYTVQQFHVVGVNSMKRELQKHIKHATGDSKNNNTPKRVELQDQLVYVDDCALKIDVQAVIDTWTRRRAQSSRSSCATLTRQSLTLPNAWASHRRRLAGPAQRLGRRFPY